MHMKEEAMKTTDQIQQNKNRVQKLKHMFKALLASFICMMSLNLSSNYSFAQAEDAGDDDPLAKDVSEKSLSSKVKYISLFVGIEAQERVDVPTGAELGGDFRKFTHASVDRGAGIIRFTPTKIGIGTLTIRQGTRILHEFRIDVKKSDLTKVAKDIQNLLRDIDGITIKIVNNRVVVDGQVLLPREINRIHSVLKQFEGQASSLVILSPIAERKIAQMIEADIHIPSVTVRTVNGKFLLEGEVNDASEKERCMTIAQTYIPDLIPLESQKDGVALTAKTQPVINLITIKPPPEKPAGKIIQLVLHFVELNKDYEKNFGFNWTPGIDDSGSGVTFSTSSGGTSSTGTTITGTIKSLFPRLNWAKTHGHARILDSAEILVQDGQKGVLSRSTQYPYQVLGPNGTTGMAYKDVPFSVDITPRMVNGRSDNINLTLNFEVAEVAGTGSGGTPIVNSNKVNTFINVRSGQSAAIAGLVRNSASTGYNRMPAGSANPIFTLIASKQFQHSQSQFVVFVTPVIKSSASQGSDKIKQKFRLKD